LLLERWIFSTEDKYVQENLQCRRENETATRKNGIRAAEDDTTGNY